MENKIIKKEISENIDLFWKARLYRSGQKNTDWYWFLWIGSLSFILILVYYANNKFLAIFVFLVTIIASVSHKFPDQFREYRINNNGIILDDGNKQISYDEIDSFNIDMENRYILINTKKKYERVIRIPFEANHNITVVEEILKSKLRKDEKLNIPTLELWFEKILGF